MNKAKGLYQKCFICRADFGAGAAQAHAELAMEMGYPIFLLFLETFLKQ
jgi:hypothetical protein